MDEWGVFQTIIVIVGFLVTIIPFVVKLTTVIQKNTYAINALTTELKELTINNNKDHEHFHRSINHLEQDVAILKEQHRKD